MRTIADCSNRRSITHCSHGGDGLISHTLIQMPITFMPGHDACTRRFLDDVWAVSIPQARFTGASESILSSRTVLSIMPQRIVPVRTTLVNGAQRHNKIGKRPARIKRVMWHRIYPCAFKCLLRLLLYAPSFPQEGFACRGFG